MVSGAVFLVRSDEPLCRPVQSITIGRNSAPMADPRAADRRHPDPGGPDLRRPDLRTIELLPDYFEPEVARPRPTPSTVS